MRHRVNVGQFRAAALWQFGGYAQNNASNGSYQLQVGADIPTWGKSVLSLDAIYSYVRDSVSLSLAPGRRLIEQRENGNSVAPPLPAAGIITPSKTESPTCIVYYPRNCLRCHNTLPVSR
jgi:hypothetical protein